MPLDRNHLLKMLVAERGRLLGFMYTVCRDRELAEDMFQNLVVITTEHSPEVETREQFFSWARTTSRYGLYNAMRKQRRAIPLTDSVLTFLEDEWEAAYRDRGSSQADALEECMRSLTPNVRNLLWLRYDMGLTCAEVAEKLNRRLNAVHVALSRTYRVLAQCIEQRLASQGGSRGRNAH
jgi:RNA polymerase sigma-70 factor (ECF subfamily)